MSSAIGAEEIMLGTTSLAGGKKMGQREASKNPANQQELALTAIAGLSMSSVSSCGALVMCAIFMLIVMTNMKKKNNPSMGGL